MCIMIRAAVHHRLHLILPLDDGGDDKFVKAIAQDPTKHGTDAVRSRSGSGQGQGQQRYVL